MKAMLVFDLPDENDAFEAAVLGTKSIDALSDVNSMFRQLLKYGDPSKQFKSKHEAVEKLWEEFRQKLEDNNIPLSKL